MYCTFKVISLGSAINLYYAKCFVNEVPRNNSPWLILSYTQPFTSYKHTV